MNKQWKNLTLILIINYLLFMSRWFSDEIFENLFIFCIPIYFVLVLAYIIISIYVFIDILKNRKIINFIVLIIMIIGIILNVFFPFQKIKYSFNFKKYFDQRNEVINYVRDDDIILDENNKATLPLKYCNLSSECKIKVYQANDSLVVGFSLYRGFLGEGSKLFVYSSGKDEVKNIKKSIDYIFSIKKLDDNWYYVVLE